MPDTSEERHTEFQFWKMKNVLKMEGNDFLKCQLYLKIFKAVNFMLYAFYNNLKKLDA